jgi:hypothetical protein
MIIHPSLLSLRLRIHDQYPDRGDRVEEILFGYCKRQVASLNAPTFELANASVEL